MRSGNGCRGCGIHSIPRLDSTTRDAIYFPLCNRRCRNSSISSFTTGLAKLRSQSLPQVLAVHERTPQRLRSMWQTWRSEPSRMKSAKPALAFAVIGQARADETISPHHESRLLGELLTLWAVADAVGRGRSSTTVIHNLQTRTQRRSFKE